MPSWYEMGAAFNTLRELDVSAIREEAERGLMIAASGDRAQFDQLAALLRATGTNRHEAVGAIPFLFRPVASSADDEALRGADLLLLVFDGRRALPVAETAPLGRLAALAVPTVIVIVGAASSAELGPPRPEFAHAEIVVVPALDTPEALNTVAAGMLKRLPSELHLAAARRLPGLRHQYSQELINQVSFSNASFATVSAIPQQIPILSVPFVAADMLVLTKNQALMVYRIGLAHGAPPEFRERMAELGTVVGGGFVWRQLARSLVGLVPIWGVIPKVAVAYAGTFATGTAAWRWFADGELLSGSRLRQLTNEALEQGRRIATTLVEATKRQGEQARRGLAQLPLPGRRPASPPSAEAPKQPE
jgi:uncharacterized protein (DUF697 family)